MHQEPTRRTMLKLTTSAALGLATRPGQAFASHASAAQTPPAAGKAAIASDQRPHPSDRKFASPIVEEFITRTQAAIGDPALAALFANCYPNTLDTTVEPGRYQGKPDTVVITGDIAAMWLRDSSAQVWPYLPLAARDPRLRALLEGVIRRQTRCLLIDTYANAFMGDLDAPPLEWSRSDKTEMKQGVGERKYELDSLCYPIRLAHGYWKSTGDTQPFDAAWQQAMTLVVATMRTQQRKHGPGPYHYQRAAPTPTETLGGDGYGVPVNPVGLIFSGFRPSDDACVLPFLVPSNLFAVTSLRHLAEMAQGVLHDYALAQEAAALASEVERALQQHAVVSLPSLTGIRVSAPAGGTGGGRGPGSSGGSSTIWAYEVDGFGGQILMDDANVPSLLALPYLSSSPDAGLYARTRQFVWSHRNPWFFQGSAGEGIGGPHVGADMIWPMSQIIYALTSTRQEEVRRSLAMLKAAAAGSGFMHESYNKEDPSRFTRSWFAWANTLFGELIATLVEKSPALLRA